MKHFRNIYFSIDKYTKHIVQKKIEHIGTDINQCRLKNTCWVRTERKFSSYESGKISMENDKGVVKRINIAKHQCLREQTQL